MDRRSWLWRKRSSEKSPGESESSGSISSERFSDGQASPSQTTQSPEVTSKAVTIYEDVNETVKALTEKLSAALINISVKEDLVKQHAKVAEEAVSGWEKAENEVVTLKQQLEAVNLKNSGLEDRVGHLEGALKECVRQLRQSRGDQDQKLHDVVAKKTSEWEMTKSVLETQIIELQTQLQITKIETESDFCSKLKVAEKEKSSLRTDLLSLAKELEDKVIERDLSTQAAEMASKQHLDSIKKMAKLEAECRKLKAMIRKASPARHHKSLSPPSVYAESSIDTQSDCLERLLAVEMDLQKTRGSVQNQMELCISRSMASPLIVEPDQRMNGQDLGSNAVVTSLEINLMDDFLEMERLASLPIGSQSCHINAETGSDNNPLKSQLEKMIQITAELEEKLERIEFEKMDLETALTECQNQLETIGSQLKAENGAFVELGKQLNLMNDVKEAAEEELMALKTKLEASESQTRKTEAEIKALVSKVCSLEEENERERALAASNLTKFQKLEDELSRTKKNGAFLHETEIIRAKSANEEFKLKQEEDLALAAVKFAECQKTMASLSQQLNSLATLDDFLIDEGRPSRLHVQVS